MKHQTQRWLAAAALGALSGVRIAAGGITNAVPWSDSFEAYTNGMLIAGTNGWTADTAQGGVVSTDPTVIGLLTNSAAFPLPSTTHTSVLQVASQVMNDLGSATGGVVATAFMVMPTWLDSLPAGDTNLQYTLCVSTNGRLTIWHYNVSLAANQWLELTNSPWVGTNAWTRFTVLHDYSNRLFQVQVNADGPIADNAGWTAGGLNPTGSWFHMVQTNATLSGFTIVGAPAYLDDLLVTNRTLTWSGTGVTESTVNNGTIAPPAITVTLAYDTFTGGGNEDFVANGKATVTHVPAGLTAVVTRASSTTVSIALTNAALQHESANTISNLTVRFTDTAFSHGNAWDVTGYQQTNLTVSFLDTPRLVFSTNTFVEAAANDGSISDAPLQIWLTNGTFNSNGNATFGTNLNLNLPAGLTGDVFVVTNTLLQVRLLGRAAAHNVANNTSVTFTFLDGAFSGVPASSVLNNNTNLLISYIDPSVLTYSATVFNETIANDGSVNGATLSLVNGAFDATNGEDLVASGKATSSVLPTGLGLQILRGATAQDATLLFTGNALAHAASNTVTNLVITFLDGAFVGGYAAGVTNNSLSNLRIQFTDPRILAYSGTTFTEISGGSIDNRNPVIITLSADTLTGANGDDFVAAGKVTIANLPPGLTPQIARNSDTQLGVQLIGIAPANDPANSVNNVVFTFQSGAFTGGNAVYVNNYQLTGISVNFILDTGFFNVMPYQEPFEEYPNGLWLAGTNGWSAPNFTDAAIVTNDTLINSNEVEYLAAGHSQLPVAGAHTQVLYVQDYIEDAIHSESAPLVYVDFMTIPVAMQAPPESDTNLQYAFYVSTNNLLMLWHQNRTAAPVNEWMTFTNAGTISTSSWVRFTVTLDYAHSLYQLQVNEARPATDPRGWTAAGQSPTGSWFHMVQTNGSLTAWRMSGVGVGYLDDLTVKTSLSEWFGVRAGSMFKLR